MPHAIRVHEFGEPERLVWEEAPVRELRAGEALVKHTAVGLNFVETAQRRGLMQIRLPFTPGNCAAGIVEAVAPDASDVKVGDRVAYAPVMGSYSELRTIPAWRLLKLPERVRERSDRGQHIPKGDLVAWQKILYRKGWIAPAWPKEYGGTGWSLAQRYIYTREYFLSGAPLLSPFGLSMVGPVIYTFGTSEQKQRYLQDILESNVWWCQAYSEPGAGSDLASLTTRAVRDGDSYVVNGQKIWTSFAHWAEMMFCLVRTGDGKPQDSISFLLIDMDTPGIEIRPIIGLDGEHTLNQVILENVRVPLDNLVGEENKGWTYAKFLLGHERNATARVARSIYQLARLKKIAAEEPSGEGRLIDDKDFRTRIARIEADVFALDAMEMRHLSNEIAGVHGPADASMLKLRGSEVVQAIKSLTLEAFGPYGPVFENDAAASIRNDGPVGPDYAHGAMADHLYHRAATIFGGTNEIQRNIVSKILLG